MYASKLVLDIGAIVYYIIEAWGTLPSLNDLYTNWIKHGIASLSGLLGLTLLFFTSPFAEPLPFVVFAGLILVGVGSTLSFPLLLMRILFWTQHIQDLGRIETPIKVISKIASITSGLGLILQLFNPN